MISTRITAIEWGLLESHRPRIAGSNARLGVHGDIIHLPIVRLTTEDGASGFGASWATPDEAAQLLGSSLDSVFFTHTGVDAPWLMFDYPLWDLVGQHTRQPVYALAATMLECSVSTPLAVRCYDTSLYFDDLHLRSTEDAASLIADEARTGYARGHRAFKLKVGRGARHMPLAEGTARDIAIIRGVRETIGAQAPLLIDANNGFNLNLAKHVLQETADCNIYWLEEPFHEDPILYHDLKQWLAQQQLQVLIADGEGDASPHLLDWAHQGLIDVIQYDILGHGFTRWLQTARQLDAWGIHTAPHHYGSHYGNYVACHLAGAVRHFSFVEWDEAHTPGLQSPGYAIADGCVSVPSTPGFGLSLDEETFQRAVVAAGGALRV